MRESIYHRGGLTGACLLAAVAVLLSTAACRRGTPIIDTTPPLAHADGTLSGSVRGPAGTSPVEARTVVVTNVATGGQRRVVTNNVGGFSFKLPPGKYRVELVLLEGETLVKRPGIITLDPSDVDAFADFIIGSSKAARPRSRNPTTSEHGLGSPIA